MKKKVVSVLGCGWYGLPLGKRLVDIGYTVKGSTTTSEKLSLISDAKIEPFLVHLLVLDAAPFPMEFLDADVLIINIPPERREDIVDYYFSQMNVLLGFISKSRVKEIILISSTSVYPDGDYSTDEKNEVCPDKVSGKASLRAEKLFESQSKAKLLILRFAGLIGADRNPGRFLAEKRNLKDGDAPVNLVELEDCIDITVRFLEKSFESEIYNVCGDQHPLRKDFYRDTAIELGLKPPEFVVNETKKQYKIVSNDNLKKALGGYQFKQIGLGCK